MQGKSNSHISGFITKEKKVADESENISLIPILLYETGKQSNYCRALGLLIFLSYIRFEDFRYFSSKQHWFNLELGPIFANQG
jgi:hypothetical protein